MRITIPIYIEQQPQPQPAASLYLVRPLFFTEPVGRDEELQRAISRFAKAMRQTLGEAGRKIWHGELASYSFAPDLTDHLLSFQLDLKTRKAAGKFLFVTFHSLDRRLAFSPNLPDLWFEIERGETLEARAIEVLTEHFRGKRKRRDEHVPRPEDFSIAGKAVSRWALLPSA